jgi:hypothetical protein
MVMKRHIKNPLQKKAKKGFRGYPLATIAYYGPNNETASKVAVGIIFQEGAEPTYLEKWVLEQGDVRTDPTINEQIFQFIEKYPVRSVLMANRIIGCPHEEGIDYPEGDVCPKCPYWAHRDRWTGTTIH